MHPHKANERCAKNLATIKEYITASDRRAAMKHFNISYVTISRYLNGQVANLVLGINLYAFFKKRIRRYENLVNRFLNDTKKLRPASPKRPNGGRGGKKAA
jgi:hypothetical protein